MEGVFLKNYLIAHSNIEMNDIGNLSGDWNKFSEMSTDEQIELLAEYQIKHAEAIIKKLGVE